MLKNTGTNVVLIIGMLPPALVNATAGTAGHAVPSSGTLAQLPCPPTEQDSSARLMPEPVASSSPGKCSAELRAMAKLSGERAATGRRTHSHSVVLASSHTAEKPSKGLLDESGSATVASGAPHSEKPGMASASTFPSATSVVAMKSTRIPMGASGDGSASVKVSTVPPPKSIKPVMASDVLKGSFGIKFPSPLLLLARSAIRESPGGKAATGSRSPRTVRLTICSGNNTSTTGLPASRRRTWIPWSRSCCRWASVMLPCGGPTSKYKKAPAMSHRASPNSSLSGPARVSGTEVALDRVGGRTGVQPGRSSRSSVPLTIGIEAEKRRKISAIAEVRAELYLSCETLKCAASGTIGGLSLKLFGMIRSVPSPSSTPIRRAVAFFLRKGGSRMRLETSSSTSIRVLLGTPPSCRMRSATVGPSGSQCASKKSVYEAPSCPGGPVRPPTRTLLSWSCGSGGP